LSHAGLTFRSTLSKPDAAQAISGLVTVTFSNFKFLVTVFARLSDEKWNTRYGKSNHKNVEMRGLEDADVANKFVEFLSHVVRCSVSELRC